MTYLWKQFKLAMKIIFFPVTIVLWILSTFYSVQAEEPKSWNENDFTKVLAKELNLKTQCGTVKDKRRYYPDLCGKDTVWEVEWGDKDYEAIGQSLTYAHIFDLKPGIIFLASKKSHIDRIKTAMPVADKYGIKVMIYLVNRKTGSFEQVG